MRAAILLAISAAFLILGSGIQGQALGFLFALCAYGRFDSDMSR